MRLSEIKAGKTVKIVTVECDDGVKEKLKNVGVAVGVTVKAERVAILGTPIEIKCGNSRIAINKAQADKIAVEYAD